MCVGMVWVWCGYGVGMVWGVGCGVWGVGKWYGVRVRGVGGLGDGGSVGRQTPPKHPLEVKFGISDRHNDKRQKAMKFIV